MKVLYYYFGSLITLGIYHFLVYIGRKKDYSNIAYTSYCFGIAGMLYTKHILHQFYQNNSIFSRSIFFLFCYIVAGAVPIIISVIFINRIKVEKLILKFKKIKQFVKFYYYGMGIIAIFSIIISMILNKNILKVNFITIGIYAVLVISILIYTFFSEKQYKNLKLLIIFIGFSLVIIILIIYSIFEIASFYPPRYIFYTLCMFNAFFFAYALTSDFNQEHHDLIDLTNTLEQKVLDRTKDLQKAKDQIEQKEKQKTIAFTNIFHEIKTPLTLISNYVEKHIKNYGTSEEIKIARDNIDKLKRDVLNALDYEKLDREMVFYDHSQITDISDIIKMNIFMYKELAQRKNIKVKFNSQDNVYIKMDKNSIDRVINNLIDNAVKYTNNNGEINITLKADKKNIEFIINDTGIGISKEEQKNIFKPYYQISYQKSNIQGIGMGLNIVKKIITKVNGKIEVESEKDKGTTFTIKLKRYYLKKGDRVEFISKDKESTVDIMSIKLKELKYKKDKPNVFIVEDNTQMLSYLQESLYDKYNFYYAVNGKDALEKIEKIHIPDIIISDIMMDEMDGYEFFNELNKMNEKYKSIPFIYLTAKTTENEKIKGLKKGAIDFISKPFSIEELLAKIESIIKNEKAKRENDIIKLADEFRNYLINKTNKKTLEDKIEGKDNNVLDKLYIEYGISKRQIEIFSLIENGYERKEIADKLNVSLSTIKTHIERLYKKFGVHNKVSLIKTIKSL